MKAAVLTKLNSPLEILDVELTPLQVGQVLVKIYVSGLCGTQLHEISGWKGNEKFLPHLLGHEGCGIVEDIGPGVTNVKIGDKVVMHWRVGKGIESPFPNYILNGKRISSGKITTLSEYSIVSENRLTAVNSETPNYLCAMLGCSMTTAFGVIDNEANLKFGENLLIIGCGGVGLNTIQAAKIAGTNEIFAIDKELTKRNLVESLGANFISPDIEINTKIDVIVDTVGNMNIFSKYISVLNSGGRYILVGQLQPNIPLVVPNAMSLFEGKGKTIKASQGGETIPSEDIPRYIKMYKMGLIKIDSLVTHVYDLNDVNKAFDVLRSGIGGRIMIKM